MKGLIAWVLTVPTSSVLPSLAARATAAAPTLPPAPARLSTTNGVPYFCCRPCARMRPNMSVVPPAVHGTTMVTWRCGQSCDGAGQGRARAGSAIANVWRRTGVFLRPNGVVEGAYTAKYSYLQLLTTAPQRRKDPASSGIPPKESRHVLERKRA